MAVESFSYPVPDAPESRQAPAVRLDAVSKRFGDVTAVAGIDLEIADGEFFSMLGPSGSGKTSTLRMIAGFEAPTEGRIRLHGRDVTGVPPFDRDVNTVFQDYALFPHMSVLDNVAYGLRVRGIGRRERNERAMRALASVRLEQLAGRKPSQLSGGQRQRMALARALAVEPKVLLLDEPFGALDAKVRKELREWLRRLHDEVNVTTVFVTHDQEEALEVADEIVVINDGRIEQVGTPDDLYDRPANDFVMSFLGEVTTLGDVRLRPHDIDLSVTPHLAGAIEGTVARQLRIGFEVRLQVHTVAGQEVSVVMTRAHASTLGVEEGRTVWLSPATGSTSVPSLAEASA